MILKMLRVPRAESEARRRRQAAKHAATSRPPPPYNNRCCQQSYTSVHYMIRFTIWYTIRCTVPYTIRFTVSYTIRCMIYYSLYRQYTNRLITTRFVVVANAIQFRLYYSVYSRLFGLGYTIRCALLYMIKFTANPVSRAKDVPTKQLL